MAHPQNRNDTPELRLRCLTEFPPRQGTYPSGDTPKWAHQRFLSPVIFMLVNNAKAGSASLYRVGRFHADEHFYLLNRCF